MQSTSSGTSRGTAADMSNLYRAIWRWHFYAGLFVLPFVIILAVTGAIYLFKDELNDRIYGDLRIVEAQSSAPLQPSELVARALAAHPGELRAYAPAAAADRAAQVAIVGEDGVRDVVYLNPYTGDVLGSLEDGSSSGSPAMLIVRKLHSLEYVGWVGNWIMEAVAGWMVILVATGIYLWLPRGRQVGVVTVKRTKGRPFWRDLHAVTGIFVSGFIVFLAITGLPWSAVWGPNFYDLSYRAGLGMPDGYWSSYPVSTQPVAEAVDRAPWIMERQPMPVSGAAEGVPARLDDVVRTVEERGIHPGYALNVPRTGTGVFTASVYPDNVTQERVIHLDQYSGEVLFDMGLDDLGALGKAAEWGISIHMGQAFGPINQIVLFLACMAMIALSVSAAVMWWKRRPSGKLGVPPMPNRPGLLYGVVGILAIGGIIFPLVGLSLIVMAIIDWAFFQSRRPQPA